MSTRRAFLEKLAILSMFSAISIVLVALIRIPMFISFLEYDPADITILLCGIFYGPASGMLVTVVVAALQSLLFSPGSGIIGFIMHVIATGGMMVITSAIFRFCAKRIKNNYLRLGMALFAGAVFMIVAMVVMNLLLTPIYTHMPAKDIWEQFMFVAIVPFNVVKALINSAATILLYPIIIKAIPQRLLDIK